MKSPKKIITVICTGNICRSPMAERLLAHALSAEAEPLCQYEVRSAGLAAGAGDPASENSVRALKAVKLDLSDHRSRPFSPHMAETSDLILTMTGDHAAAIRDLFHGLEAPVFRFREWMDDGAREVPDPFGGPLDLYTETRDSLAEAVPSILHQLRSGLLK